jgi:hypothetical protein
VSASAWDDDQASELRLDTLLLLADAGVSSGPQAGHQTPTLERDQHSGPPPGQLPHREGQAAVAHPDAASACSVRGKPVARKRRSDPQEPLKDRRRNCRWPEPAQTLRHRMRDTDGMGNHMTFSQDDAKRIGAAVGIDWTTSRFDVEQFRMGLEVELEHGRRDAATNVSDDDEITTGKIAWAHLNEFCDYYTRLAKMEAEAEAYWAQHGPGSAGSPTDARDWPPRPLGRALHGSRSTTAGTTTTT